MRSVVGGAVFTMSSVLDFPTWLPPGMLRLLSCRCATVTKICYIGTKMPGGMVTPVS